MDDTTNSQPPIDSSVASSSDGISPDQITSIKTKAVADAKDYAMAGKKTIRVPKPEELGNKSPYDLWTKEDNYEGVIWSVAYWDYDTGPWEIQATKVETLPNGHSQVVSYSVRPDNAERFPGFQIYREGIDDSYHAGAVEDVVYLHRVFEGLKALISPSAQPTS